MDRLITDMQDNAPTRNAPPENVFTSSQEASSNIHDGRILITCRDCQSQLWTRPPIPSCSTCGKYYCLEHWERHPCHPEERRKQKERVEKELKESEIVKNVMAFGYGPEIVKKVLEEKLAAGEAADSENIFDGVMSLLDAVQKQEKAFEEEQRATDVKMPAGASNFMEPTPSTSGMETPVPSMESLPPSGVAQVSGFNVDSEDEDMDLYGSLPSGQAEEAAAGPSQPEPQPGVFNIPQDQGSIKDMYEQQMDERLCKICFDNIADMVFVPCGHIACCLQCTQAIRQCPACRVRIEKAIRVYTS